MLYNHPPPPQKKKKKKRTGFDEKLFHHVENATYTKSVYL